MKILLAGILALGLILLPTEQSLAKKKREVRKVQEVSFGEMDLKGTARNPEGAYLVQKRGIKFLPLYEVQKDFDSNIRESAAYMK